MAKSVKEKFDRDCGLKITQVAIFKKLIGEGEYETRECGKLIYDEDGTVTMLKHGFEHRITSVDEVEVVYTPLDVYFTKITVKVKKIDEVSTLPHQFYGVRGSNLIVEWESEISGSAEMPDE